MAADEEEPQDVVAVIGLVDPFYERLLGIGEVRHQLLRRERLLTGLPAEAVDASVPADGDQPGSGVARWAVARPGPQGAQARVPERLLRRVEVAEIPQERRNRLGTRRGEDRADPALVRHFATVPGLKRPTGRIS